MKFTVVGMMDCGVDSDGKPVGQPVMKALVVTETLSEGGFSKWVFDNADEAVEYARQLVGYDERRMDMTRGVMRYMS